MATVMATAIHRQGAASSRQPRPSVGHTAAPYYEVDLTHRSNSGYGNTVFISITL